MTFEIIPARPRERLPADLRDIEGGRLTIEGILINGQRYQKASIVLPLPGGDTQERVLFFAEEADGIRLLGFHNLRRHLESPQGETVVFDSGRANPLGGRILRVSPDTYTLLALCVALAGASGTGAPLQANLWLNEQETVPVRITVEEREDLAVLGTRIAGRRIRVEPTSGGSWIALYWFADSPPHGFLQYRGPAAALSGSDRDAPPLVLRATSSSEQVRKAFPR